MLKIKIKNSYSDNKLIEIYKETSDKEAIAILYKRYTRFVFLVAMKFIKDEETAKEIASVVFEKIINELTNREIKYFKSWLYVVVRNECMLLHRKNNLRMKKEQDYEYLTKNFVEIQSFEHLNREEQKQEQISELNKALALLSEEQRKCIELFYLEEKSYLQISQLTGYSLKNVKSYLQNGKRNLKKKLQTSGLFLLLILLTI